MKNLSDLREDEDEVSASQQQEDLLIVGTVFKQQERKPSILKELSEPSEDGKPLVSDRYLMLCLSFKKMFNQGKFVCCSNWLV